MVVSSIRHALQMEAQRAPITPASIAHERKRATNIQNRIADTITNFAGSMAFVYVHILWFALWISLPVEHYPFGLLTMIVSLEAIFLSTFLLISQNRTDARRQVVANEQYLLIQEEKKQNELMIDQNKRIEALDKAILELTQEVRKAINR